MASLSLSSTVNELVSMNMWGLTPAFMDTLYNGFVEFLKKIKPGDIKGEYLLPVMIDDLIQNGKAQVEVLETKDTWFGVTYQEDKEVVIKAFEKSLQKPAYTQTDFTSKSRKEALNYGKIFWNRRISRRSKCSS